MKYLCKTIYIMLILCVICTCVVGCATSDDMTTSDVPDEELTIFRCGDYYYNVDGWTDVMNFSSSNIDIPDGGCARIVADVTYMWGGVAGFNKDVGVNEIKEARLIDYQEAFPEGIKDYEWNAISGEDCLRKIMINNEWYYICLSYGDYAVYKDGERVATYTERDGKLYCEETGEYIVRDENSSRGYVTEKEEYDKCATHDKENLIAFLYISDFVDDIDVPNENDKFETYIFLKDGRLLFSDERDIYLANDEELDKLCRDGKFGEQLVVLKENMDDIPDMYSTFLNVVEEGTNDLQPDVNLEWDVKDESWYGMVYTEDGRPEKVQLFRHNGNLYINNEERVNDIVKWMDRNMSMAQK